MHIYLIINDELYRIPVDNLNTKEHVLYMFNLNTETQEPIFATKWYNHDDLRFHSVNKQDNSDILDKKIRSSDRLKHFHFFFGQSDNQPKRYFNYRSYVFDSGDMFLWSSRTKKLVISKDLIQPYKLKTMFHAVANGLDTQGYMIYYDEHATTHTYKRVLFTPLVTASVWSSAVDADGTYIDDKLHINFPKNDSTYSPFTMFAWNIDLHSRIHPVLFVPNSQSDNNKYPNIRDFFLRLPFGMIIDEHVYLLSEVNKRVYHFNYFDLQKNQYEIRMVRTH